MNLFKFSVKSKRKSPPKTAISDWSRGQSPEQIINEINIPRDNFPSEAPFEEIAQRLTSVLPDWRSDTGEKYIDKLSRKLYQQMIKTNPDLLLSSGDKSQKNFGGAPGPSSPCPSWATTAASGSVFNFGGDTVVNVSPSRQQNETFELLKFDDGFVEKNQHFSNVTPVQQFCESWPATGAEENNTVVFGFGENLTVNQDPYPPPRVENLEFIPLINKEINKTVEDFRLVPLINKRVEKISETSNSRVYADPTEFRYPRRRMF